MTDHLTLDPYFLLQFPNDLKESDKLPEPIFTPSTKAEEGHDQNVSFKHVIDMVGEKTDQMLVKLFDHDLVVYCSEKPFP